MGTDYIDNNIRRQDKYKQINKAQYFQKIIFLENKTEHRESKIYPGTKAGIKSSRKDSDQVEYCQMGEFSESTPAGY